MANCHISAFLPIKYGLVIFLSIVLATCFYCTIAIVGFGVEIEIATNIYPNQHDAKIVAAYLLMAISIVMVISIIGLVGILKEHFFTSIVFSGCMLTLSVLAIYSENVFVIFITLTFTLFSFWYSALIEQSASILRL